jgi:hypothetical protein
VQSTLADHDFVARSLGDQTLACFQRNAKGAKIAVIYSDDFCARVHRSFQLIRAMHFDKRVEP